MKFFILLLALLTTNSSYSQDEENKFYIVFCGRDGLPGHTFVAFGRQDADEKMSVRDGAWGMYPAYENSATPVGRKDAIFGEVPGKIVDELISSAEDSYVVDVTEQEYYNALYIKKKWKDKKYSLKYSLWTSDCLTFMIEIAKSINKLKLPPRLPLDFPFDYLTKLREVNGDKPVIEL